MSFVDSHCHIDFPDFNEEIPHLLQNMKANGVDWGLCAGVTLENFPRVLALAEQHDNLFAAVGVHPDHQEGREPTAQELVELSKHPKIVGIGETGLDYYRLTGDLEWQRERFRTHILAARQAGLPLIVHTRSSASDTLQILKETGQQAVSGVFHCFTENMDVAQQVLALGFYISFSGILTFKNATELKAVAREIPLDRLLIETDAPYLAPVPMRGKRNEPAYVRYVAEEISRLKGIDIAEVAEATTHNFFTLFSKARLVR